MNHEKASELVDKLLKSKAGQEILGKKLNVQFESYKPSEKPTVAVLVPCYHQPTPEMSHALRLMMRAASEVSNIYVGPEILGSSVVSWSRNYVIAELIKSQKPWDYVLMIDDDIVPEPDAIVKLLSHKKDIVAAVCTKRIDPPIPNIRRWNEEKLTFEEIFGWPDNALLEVGGVGTGMMLISRHALEQVAQAYFDCLYEKEMFGMPEDRVEQCREARLRYFDNHANAYWFRFLDGLNGSQQYGEDMSFCLMAKRYCGIPVYCDTSVQPGHIGRYPFGLKDYIPHRDQAIERAKAEGRYHVAENMKIELPPIEVV